MDASDIKSLLDALFDQPEFAQASTLLVVPPFIRVNNPSLGVHILQACALEAGHKVAIFYANMVMAKWLGEDLYNAITFSSDKNMLGDRVFTHAAYGLPALGKDVDIHLAGFSEKVRLEGTRYFTLTPNMLLQASEIADSFTRELSDFIVQRDFTVVGCTSMFNQTAASVALLNQIKSAKPELTTIIGGANCAGEMAKGVCSLSSQIDYVFDGESESVFVQFLTDLAQGKRPQQRVINGERCDDLDSIATPSFAQYYAQAKGCELNIDWAAVHLPYESSRGCWWGQKYRCSFCGVHELRYRFKSAERVVTELTELLRHHPSNYVNFTDDIMPLQYFKSLLPELETALPELRFFIDQKANLSLAKVQQLVAAGAYDILPGIESLSTRLLMDMDKGVSARQNLQLMRYAKSCQLYLSWYFLFDLPSEQVAEYQQMAQWLPLLTHLNPPVFFQQTKLLRFGQYVAEPQRFNIERLQPLAVYQQILPQHTDIEHLAYYYDGEYDCLSLLDPKLKQQLDEQVTDWRNLWFAQEQTSPILEVSKISDSQYMLKDTRPVNRLGSIRFLNQAQAAAALVGHSKKQLPADWLVDWAIENQLAIIMDDAIVPLATAEPALLASMESCYKATRAGAQIEVINVAAELAG